MKLPIDLNERDIDRLSVVSEAYNMSGAEAAVMLIQQGLARHERLRTGRPNLMEAYYHDRVEINKALQKIKDGTA